MLRNLLIYDDTFFLPFINKNGDNLNKSIFSKQYCKIFIINQYYYSILSNIT